MLEGLERSGVLPAIDCADGAAAGAWYSAISTLVERRPDERPQRQHNSLKVTVKQPSTPAVMSLTRLCASDPWWVASSPNMAASPHSRR